MEWKMIENTLKVTIERVHTSRVKAIKDLAKSFGADSVKHLPIRKEISFVNVTSSFRLNQYKDVKNFREACKEVA